MTAAGVWEVMIESSPQLYERVRDWLEEQGHSPVTRLLTTNEAATEGDWAEGSLSVFVESKDTADHLVDTLRCFEGELTVTLQFLPEASWRDVWDESLETFATDRFIVQSAPHATATGRIPIKLKPSGAFGDGKHVTTRLMLAFLDTLLQSRIPRSFLDVGCGNGVLGIAAALAGVPIVVATDVDEEAILATHENMALNTVSIDVRLDAHPFDGRTFDWVVANIPAAGLKAIMGELRRSLAPGGLLVMAGFFAADAALVEQAAFQEGLGPVSSREENGWMVVSFQEVT